MRLGLKSFERSYGLSGGDTYNRPDYTHYVVLMSIYGRPVIESGWSYKEDADDRRKELIEDRPAGSVRVYAKQGLQKKGLDPNNDNDWSDSRGRSALNGPDDPVFEGGPEDLLHAALKHIQSASMREHAQSAHNWPIWTQIAEGALKKNKGRVDPSRFATYMTAEMLGL